MTANAALNARYRLHALGFEADFLGLGSYGDNDLLTLATSGEPPVARAFIPPVLRPIADLGEPSMRQGVDLGETANVCTGDGATVAFLINGRVFDPDRVDLVTAAGRVGLWEINNHTSMAHPFHIHGTQFQLGSRRM